MILYWKIGWKGRRICKDWHLWKIYSMIKLSNGSIEMHLQKRLTMLECLRLDSYLMKVVVIWDLQAKTIIHLSEIKNS